MDWRRCYIFMKAFRAVFANLGVFMTGKWLVPQGNYAWCFFKIWQVDFISSGLAGFEVAAAWLAIERKLQNVLMYLVALCSTVSAVMVCVWLHILFKTLEWVFRLFTSLAYLALMSKMIVHGQPVISGRLISRRSVWFQMLVGWMQGLPDISTMYRSTVLNQPACHQSSWREQVLGLGHWPLVSFQ